MVAGYTRQAAANIQPGLRCNAEDVNAEYNQLATAFDNTAGHDHTGSVAGDGAKISLTASVTGVLPVANGGTGSNTSPPTLTAINVNPGGVLVGTAGSVPGAGNLTLNANTVAPPAGLTGQIYAIGPDGTANPGVSLDGFGTGTFGLVQVRKARGTAAAPTAVQAGDHLFITRIQGRGATSYGSVANPAVFYTAAENWTDTVQGSQITFQTAPVGSATPVSSLVLGGNSATFSGSVATGGTAPPANADNGSLLVSTPITATQGFLNNLYSVGGTWTYRAAGFGAMMLGDGGGGWNFFSAPSGSAGGAAAVAFIAGMALGGNFTIAGATGTKASGTTWANPSARDLKENIQPYSQGLQAVLALNPCTYEFAADSGIDATGEHIGLIHDETAHMPEMHRTLTLGSGDDAREVDGLDCSAVTFALINSIKELTARLEALEQRFSTP